MKSLFPYARIIALVIACVAVVAPVRAADDAPPPIRVFDIATIEKLGRQMYDQDQFAWKATDVLRASHDLPGEGIRGWLVETLPDRTRVVWIRDNGGTLEAAYDVDFVGNAAPALAKPGSPALTDVERAQFAARQLAIQNIGQRCFETYNTIVLKDPEGDGWLVWVLGATTDPHALVVGGHYRFTISADGKTIRQRDALSNGCLILPAPGATEGETYAGSIITHYVSLTPIETYVFTSLGLPAPVYVGTLDGTAWKIDHGHVSTIDMDSPGTDGYSARAIAGLNEVCEPAFRRPDGKLEFGDRIKVIALTERADKLSIRVPEGATFAAIGCARQSIVPAPNDYKVLFSGVPLIITDKGVGHATRTGTIYFTDGRVRYHLEESDHLSTSEEAGINARLEAFQKAFVGSRRPH